MSYSYWNYFINTWRQLSEYDKIPYLVEKNIHIYGWINPNLVPLLNISEGSNYSLEYLPEPWWGNSGNSVLNSIVINYNPGKADHQLKHYSVQKIRDLFDNPNYSTLVNNIINQRQIFPATNSWHQRTRASRIFNTITRAGVDLFGHTELENHLSIELIPWHTEKADQIDQYLLLPDNLKQVFANCLLFAANESRRIANEKLKNKVILRISGDKTLKLLNALENEGICKYSVLINKGKTPKDKKISSESTETTGTGGYFKFIFVTFPDVEFISIWGNGNNDFPPNGDMDWIFKNIL